MKARRIIMICMIFLAAFPFADASAADDEGYEYFGFSGIEENVPDGARELLDGAEISPSLDAVDALGSVLSNALDSLGGILKNAAGEAASALAVTLLCSLAGSVLPNGGGTEYITLAGAAAIGAVSLTGVTALAGTASEVMEELSAFSKALLPTLAAASAAAGYAGSSAAKYAAASMFIDILITLGGGVVLPIVYMYLAVSLGNCAFGGLSGIAKLLEKACRLILTVISMAFVTLITLTGIVSSAADEMAVKITKSAISAFLPVVGGIVSDAADAAASGVIILRNAAGAFGTIAAVAICVLPFMRLAVRSVLYRLAAALSETIADRRLSALIGAVSTAYAMVLGLAGACAIMLFVSIVSITRAVAG